MLKLLQARFIVVSSNHAHYFDAKVMAEQLIYFLCFIMMAITFVLVFLVFFHSSQRFGLVTRFIFTITSFNLYFIIPKRRY